MLRSLFSHLPRYSRFITYPLWLSATVIYFNDYVIEVVKVRGSSMSPTLSPRFHETGVRDCITLQKWQPSKDLKRGDVVTFWAPHKQDAISIKRVVGLEGDRVHIDRKRWKNTWGDEGEMGLRPGSGDGKKAIWTFEEDGEMNRQLGLDGHKDDSRGRWTVVVPPGHVWLEGDNWRLSTDSNYYGPVSKGLITGKATSVIWPWDRKGKVPWGTGRGERVTKVDVGHGWG